MLKLLSPPSSPPSSLLLLDAIELLDKIRRYQISLTSLPSACLNLSLPSVVTPGTSGFAVYYPERAQAQSASFYSLPAIHSGLAKSQESLSFAPNQSLVTQLRLLGQALFSDQISF